MTVNAIYLVSCMTALLDAASHQSSTLALALTWL